MQQYEYFTKPSGIDPKKLAWMLNNELSIYRYDFPYNDVETGNVFYHKLTGEDLDNTVKEKLNAYRALLTSTMPFEHWHVFEKVASTLLDGIANVEYLEPPSDIEILCTVYIVNRDTEKKFNDEVKTYIRTAWQKQYGYLVLHPIMLNSIGETKMTKEKQAVLDRFEEILFSDEVPEESDDMIEMQALRLLNLEILLRTFINGSELPLEVINLKNKSKVLEVQVPASNEELNQNG